MFDTLVLEGQVKAGIVRELQRFPITPSAYKVDYDGREKIVRTGGFARFKRQVESRHDAV